jgi:hypothetical protein
MYQIPFAFDFIKSGRWQSAHPSLALCATSDNAFRRVFILEGCHLIKAVTLRNKSITSLISRRMGVGPGSL